MNKSIRESRIDAIKIIYSCEMSGGTVADIAATVLEDNLDEIAIKLSMFVVKNKNEIDDIISNSLVNYSISRLNLVDKAIVELATSEMMNGTDPKIAINEALEITKQYSDSGDKKAVSFNNRLLDNIKKSLNK